MTPAEIVKSRLLLGDPSAWCVTRQPSVAHWVHSEQHGQGELRYFWCHGGAPAPLRSNPDKLMRVALHLSLCAGTPFKVCPDCAFAFLSIERLVKRLTK